MAVKVIDIYIRETYNHKQVTGKASVICITIQYFYRKEGKVMKKTKLLWMLLVVLLGLCLVACSSDDDDDDDASDKKTTPTEAAGDVTPKSEKDPTEGIKPTGETKPTEAAKPTDGPKELRYLELDESIVPDDLIPTHTYVELKDPEGMSFNYYTLNIGEDTDTVLAALKQDEWLRSKGPIADYYREEGSAYPGAGYLRVSYSKGLYVAGPIEGGSYEIHAHAPAYVVFSRDTSQYANENGFSVNFSEVDFENAAETENIARIVKMVFGEDLAKILLYAKDVNADEEKPFNLSLSVVKDGMKYRFSRYVYSLNGENPSVSYGMSVQTEYPQVYWYVGDYEPIAGEFGGLPNEVFEGDIGGENILDYTTFGDKFFSSSEEIKYYLTCYDVRRYICEDGREYYDMSFEPDEFKLEYTVGKTNGTVDYCSGFELKFRTSEFPKTEEAGAVSEDLIKELNRRWEVLFGYNPEFALDQFKQSSSDPAYWNASLRMKFTMWGKEVEETFRIQLDGNDKKENYGHVDS